MAGRLKQQSRLLGLISNLFRRPFVLVRPIRLIRGAYSIANQYKKIEFKERKSTT